MQSGVTLEAALETVTQREQPRAVVFRPLGVEHEASLRVLQVVTSLQRGGAERVALDLATCLPKLGVPCAIATIGGPTRDSFEVRATHFDLSASRGDRVARAQALQAVAETFGADVIHAHLLDKQDVQLLAESGLPLVLTIHNQRPGWPAGLSELPSETASLLVACSQRVEQELRETLQSFPIRTIWNGIDFDAAQRGSVVKSSAAELRRRWNIGRQDVVLLALANPRPQKRLHLLPAVVAAAQSALHADGIERDVHLLLCGEHQRGNQAALTAVAETQAEVDRLGLSQRVHWLGSTGEVATVLAASDALVSTSAFEGLSLAQVEALAAGLPIVITDVGGARDLAAGNAAVTVLPTDAGPEQFAAAIVGALRTRPTGGVEIARRNFTHTQMAERYRWIYPRAITAQMRERRGEGIWLITNNFSMGGAQSSAKRLLCGLRERGISVRAGVLEEQPDYPTPGRQELEQAGVPVLTLPAEFPPPEAVAKLLAAIDADRPAAVLCWNALAPHKLLLADGLLDIPLFDVSPGEMYFSSLARYFEKPLAAFPYRAPRDYGRRLAGVIVKYGAEADRARELLGCPVHVIPNGVDIDRLAAGVVTATRRKDARLVIGTAARLSPQKKLEELLAAVRKAHARLLPYILRIAGGPERGSDGYAANLVRLARDLPVEWLGEQADIGPFLAGLDMFVMISEPAGCPNASLEALAAGLPVVATDFGGAAEQIVHKVSGLLTPRGDAAALADALVALGQDSVLRQRLAAGGQQRAREKFSLTRMIDDYCRICLPR